MNEDIREAKRRLPLPTLMNQLSLGEHCSKSARCPFHEDHRNSFSVFQTERGWFFKCHAGCGEGDEINLLQKQKDVSRNEAIKLFLRMAGLNGCMPHNSLPKGGGGASSFNWRVAVEELTAKYLEQLADWRGYSGALCGWLHQRGLIGVYRGWIAFPIHDRTGKAVAAHYRLKDGSWRVSPRGTRMRPLLIGDVTTVDVVHVFESQWDAFAVTDKLALHEKETVALIVTRGASNGKLVAGLTPRKVSVFAWKQNDRSGDQWLEGVAGHAGAPVQVVITPLEFKDVNEWTLAGATVDELESALDRGEIVGRQVEPRPLGQLLDAICAFLQRYIVFQHSEQPIVVALWIVHTWVLDAFEYTAYLHIGSPERRCGKTRLLDCLELLTLNPLRAISPTEAVLFRTIEDDRPTLLLDELDTVFGNNRDERKEPVRALLNAGFEAKATIPRCVPPNWEVRKFRVFCPKALAGIGRLPDTVGDRAIPIQLVRRSRDEQVQRFRKREAEKIACSIRAELQAWAQQAANITTLRDSRPYVPDALSDRQADICESLLAIAELAGNEWPRRAQDSLVKLCAQNNDDESIGATLLSDIRTMFNATDADRLSTKDLLEGLVGLETDARWAEWWEHQLKNQNIKSAGQKLSRILKTYGIRARVLRLPGEPQARGYMRKDFEQVWNRYCPRVVPEM
jgi:Protein of unknown function (DUF3631)/CHC2 zinc finger